jgi:uncharacterized membrane protein YoaK (UPF0700 family)
MSDNKDSKLKSLEVSTPINDIQPPKSKKRDLPVFLRNEFNLIIIMGCFMSFNAGFVNIISITKTGTTVTHCTGTNSKLGKSLAEFNTHLIIFCLFLILSFICGGLVVGFFIRKQVFHFNRKYGFFFLAEALCFLIFEFCLEFEMNEIGCIFGSFGSGIQNALLTNLSGAVVRTTHVTGLSTDIGLFLGLYLRGRGANEVWRLKVFIPILICFCLGSLFGTIAYTKFNHHALLIPIFLIFTSALILIVFRAIKKNKKKNLKEQFLE